MWFTLSVLNTDMVTFSSFGEVMFPSEGTKKGQKKPFSLPCILSTMRLPSEEVVVYTHHLDTALCQQKLDVDATLHSHIQTIVARDTISSPNIPSQ